MGKPKNKGRKGQTEEFENDSDIELETGSKQEADEKPEVKTKAAGKKKKGKKKDDDWDDDVAAEIEALSLEANKDNPDYLKEEVEVQQKPKKKEKKKKKNKESDEEEDEDNMKEEIIPKSGGNKKAAAGFQMLMMDSDGDDNMADSDNESGKEEEEEEESVKIETVKEQQNKKKKNKGKKEKEANKGEEDIDALLAEIDKPSEKTSKKGKKKKNAADDENNIDQEIDIESKMAQVVSIDDIDDDEYDKKKKKKKGKKGKEESEDKEEESKDDKEAGEGEGEEDEDSTVKTAAQKRKEKREREKLKKQQEKKKQKGGKTEEKEISETQDTTAAAEGEEGEKPEEDEEKEGKKKKKKGEKEKEKKKKAPVAAIKAHLQKVQEEEERLRKEEEERIRREEEAIKLREEQKRIEEEKKQKKKQKEKEKKERLRQEGKLLTEKQKQDRKRAQQMLEQMKAQGIELPNKDEVPKDDVPKKRPIYFERKRKNKQQQQTTDETERTPSPLEDVTPTEPETPDEQPAELISEETEKVPEETEKEEIKDAWDVESEEEEEEDTQKEKPMETDEVKKQEKKKEEEQDEEEESEEEESEEEEEEDSEEDDEDSEEDDSEEESSEDDEELSPIEIARERIMKRKEEADKKRTTDLLRAPVVCVLGHVDTGKTKILDKLRRTHVQDGEAGGITQQIGATNVPHEAILEQTKMCKEFQKKELKVPGLLIIDTPGHESFSNLRSRGSSLCDIAILVVDIMHGLEPQTIESINLLKSRKTPFIVALNKIDRLYQWKPMPHTDVQNTIKKQSAHTKSEFDERARDAIVQLAEQGLNAALFYENKNPKEYISLVPTSAHSGDGMGNLIALISELSQTMLAKRISFSEELQATVMEVKALPGLGTTIDIILVNGKLKEGDQMVVPGTEGPIVTQIRGLLMPQPMKEIRVKSQWEHHKEVCAAQGVKIIAKDLEKALAGLPVYIAEKQDEVDYYKEELSVALKEVLGSIKLAERGVFVQASTLGSLEALLEFLRTSKIPYAGINIGPVHKKDIMKASVMLEHDSQYAVILAFDVRVEREAQEMADSVGVRIFTADIIYHLFDSFMAFRDELKKRKQEEFKHIAVFPCKLRVMPQFIFNSRDPIVMGVVVEAGFVKEGTPICIPSKEFIDIGRVVGIENNHKSVDMAKKGQEVCIKIDPIPGEAPKMYGRHFDHTDLLISKISRQSIDAVKDYFREEMGKADWQLIVELKKMFQII